MLKLVTSFSQKLPGDEDYSSRGAMVSIETEMESGISSEEILQKADLWFSLARQAVDQQLNGKRNLSHTVVDNPGQPQWKNTPGANNKNHSSNNGKTITPKQVSFLKSLCMKKFKGGVQELEQKLQQDGIQSIEALSRKQASLLIEDLKNSGR